jgi:MFS family permease
MRHLLRHRAFRLLLSARLLGHTGDGLLQGGLVGYSLFSPEKQATAWGIAAAFALVGLPYSVLGPFAGLLVDRIPRRRVIATGNAIRALLAIAISVCVVRDASYALLLPLVLVALAVNRLQLTAHAAAIACTVNPRERATANAMVPTLGSATSAIATVCAPLLAHIWSASSNESANATGHVVQVACVVWVAASLVIMRVGSKMLGPHADGHEAVQESLDTNVAQHGDQRDAAVAEPGSSSFEIEETSQLDTSQATSRDSRPVRAASWRDVWLGFTVLRQVGSARRAITVIALHRAVFGFTLLLTIMHARAQLKATSSSSSLALVAIVGGLAAGGTAVGALFAPRLAHRIGPIRTAAVGLAAAGTVLPLGWWLGMHGSHIWLYVAAPFIGVTYAAIRVGSDTVVQSVIVDNMRGRVFSVYDIIMNTCLVVGLCAAAATLTHTGAGLLVCAVLVTVTAAAHARSERHLTTEESFALSIIR